MEEREISVSIVVPFHNAESTIERTLRSLAAQTCGSFEIVAVNDGSTDRSMEIVRDFLALRPEMSGRIRVLTHRFRRGTSEARHLGLRESRGRYVGSCDADDTVDQDWIDGMLEAALKAEADLVIAPYISESSAGRSRLTRPDHIAEGLNAMTINTVNFSLCNKLIRRDFLLSNGIDFLPGVDRWEDLGLLSQVYACGPRIAHTDRGSYHYFDHPRRDSLSRSRKEILLRDHLMMALLLEKWFSDRGLAEKYAPYLRYLKFISKIKYLRGADKDTDRWLSTFPEVNSRIMSMGRVNLAIRLMCRMITVLPPSLSRRITSLSSIFYR